MFPVLSAKACAQLRPLVADCGEFLPLNTDTGDFFFLHITRSEDALDPEQAVRTFSKFDPKRVSAIITYAFLEERLSRVHIFRNVDVSIHAIVSQEFVDVVFQSELRGFAFKKLCPHPPGINWRLSKTIIPELERKTSNPQGRDDKGKLRNA